MISASSITLIEYSSDKQGLWSDCAYAQADRRLCSSHIPHCWKSHCTAHIYSTAKETQNVSTFVFHHKEQTYSYLRTCPTKYFPCWNLFNTLHIVMTIYGMKRLYHRAYFFIISYRSVQNLTNFLNICMNSIELKQSYYMFGGKNTMINQTNKISSFVLPWIWGNKSL